MPDIYGRLTLLEMRNEVRRRCDLLRYNINAAGAEQSLQQLDRLVSDEDLNMYLNMALARRCVDVNIADNTIMADEAVIDIAASVVEYALPPDLMFLRAVYFKPISSIAFSYVPPNQRMMLYEDDSDHDIAYQPSGDQIVSYRRRLNMIVLNQVPQQDNRGGLLVDYVKMMLPLRVDEQVLETSLAWMIQQVIIQDAAVEVTAQKLKLDPSELRATQNELVHQLQLAVMNYHAPKIIKFGAGPITAYPPFARRPNSWQRFSGVPGFWW